MKKQDQGSTAQPLYIFLNVLDWIRTVEDTGLGIHKLEIICKGYKYPNVHMFKISVSLIEYKSAKNPPVLNVFIGSVEETGGS